MDASASAAQDLVVALRRQLLRLAKLEEDRAADEQARVPYWTPCPPEVGALREAARVLRAEASALNAVSLEHVT